MNDVDLLAADVSAVPLKSRDAGVSMSDIPKLSRRLDRLQQIWKEEATVPDGIKRAPVFNATQLAELCGKTADQMGRLLDKAAERGLPSGIDDSAAEVKAGGRGRSRVFSLADVQAWIRATDTWKKRPSDMPGCTVTICNFKGGVGKTVIAGALAQGLSLRGYKVLCIDFDPQGSLTSLFGVEPSTVEEEQTVVPLMYPKTTDMARDTLQDSIRATYWSGVDLIPGNHSLFNGEFYLPSRQMKASSPKQGGEPGFLFWEVLNKALDAGIREEYDYIIIDTPPALSYMTLVTFWAADALLLPLPPEGIDFASSAQFWKMLGEMAEETSGYQVNEKYFRWIRVVPSKVDNTKLHTKELLSMIKSGYRDLMASTEIPETAAVRVGGARLESVYDISKYIGDRRTLLRAREAYDKLVDEVDFLTHKNVWSART